MRTFHYATKRVCAREIIIGIEQGTVASVTFRGGCDGNLKGIGQLVKGMSIREVIHRLKGIDCDGRGTSCPDQLASALEQIIKEEQDIA